MQVSNRRLTLKNASEPRDRRSDCPISVSLDIVGDRWSLVIIRDLLAGKSRFGEFLDSPEKITTNILAERLRRLESAGLIEAQPYGSRPERYEYRLTQKGRDLHPVLQEICRWAGRYLSDTWTPPASFMRKARSLRQPNAES